MIINMIHAILRREREHADYCPWHGNPLEIIPRLHRATKEAPEKLRLEYLAELEGIAFLRSCQQREPHQLAWDETRANDPMAMVDALVRASNEHVLWSLGQGLVTLGERVCEFGDGQDVHEHTLRTLHLVLRERFEAGDYMAYLGTALSFSYRFGLHAAPLAARLIRMRVPVAPWGWGDYVRGFHDEQLLTRAEQGADLLSAQERGYAQALTTRKLPLRPANRNKLIEILRRRTAWLCVVLG